MKILRKCEIYQNIFLHTHNNLKTCGEAPFAHSWLCLNNSNKVKRFECPVNYYLKFSNFMLSAKARIGAEWHRHCRNQLRQMGSSPPGILKRLSLNLFALRFFSNSHFFGLNLDDLILEFAIKIIIWEFVLIQNIKLRFHRTF